DHGDAATPQGLHARVELIGVDVQLNGHGRPGCADFLLETLELAAVDIELNRHIDTPALQVAQLVRETLEIPSSLRQAEPLVPGLDIEHQLGYGRHKGPPSHKKLPALDSNQEPLD